MANDTHKLIVLDISNLYVDLPIDEALHITRFLLNFSNTEASAKKNYYYCYALS
jgi:hypothetical protein